MKLLDLQRSFFETVSRSEGVNGDTRFDCGMRIYRNNYGAQLRSALKDTFRRVYLWLGEDAFEAATAAQICGSPPASWTLDAYGRDFPALLRKLYPEDAEVAELAWLDIAMSDAFVAADVLPVATDALADVAWDDARFRFVPLQLSEASTNAAEIWTALEEGKMPPQAERIRPRGGHLVWRQGLVPRFRFAECREYRAICALYLGLPFSHVCSTVEAEAGESKAAELVGAMLGRWLSDGLIASVHVGAHES